MPSCYQHPDQPAGQTCIHCLRPICNTCVVPEVPGVMCARCVAKQRAHHKTTRLFAFAAALLAMGGALGWHLTREPPVDHGKYSARINQLENSLKAEPCHKKTVVQLAEALRNSGDNKGVLQLAQRFEQRCGPNPRLKWYSFEAHRRLGDYSTALAEVDALIEQDSSDPDFYRWRAEVHGEMGQWNKAVVDFQQAFNLCPTCATIPFELADALEHAGRACDGIFPLEQFLLSHPKENPTPVNARIVQLRDKGQCKPYSGTGRAVIKMVPGSTTIHSTVRFNETVEGTLVVDTGATYVALTRNFALRLNISTQGLPTVLAATAGGIQKAFVTSVKVMEVQGARAQDVPVYIMDNLTGDQDGLLGMSFLSRFKVTMDQAAKQLVIEDGSATTGQKPVETAPAPRRTAPPTPRQLLTPEAKRQLLGED